MDKLNQWVDQEDIPFIKLIKPSIRGMDDQPIWAPAKDGTYTVKSGYRLLHSLNSSQLSTSKVFKDLWLLNVPPKIKYFWWRVVHNALPTAEGLKRRGIQIDTNCQLCGDHEETTNHLLFECRISKEIWEQSPLQHLSGDNIQVDLTQNIVNLMECNKNAVKDCPLYPFVGWRLWKMRNYLIFNGKKEMIPTLVNKAIKDQWQWLEATNELMEIDVGNRVQRNMNLQSELEVINEVNSWCCFVDASWVSADQRAGYGWILMDKRGAQIIKGLASLDPIETALEAEAYALRETVQQVKRLGYRGVMFCGDSRIVFDAINKKCSGESIGNQVLAVYCEDMKNMITANLDFRFKAIGREANVHADHLAKQARLSNGGCVISWIVNDN